MDVKLANPGWRIGIMTRLLSQLGVSLSSPQLRATPFLGLLVADSPSGTRLGQNHLLAVTGNASRRLSGGLFSAVANKQKSDIIMTIPTDILRRALPLEFGIFLTYYSAPQFDDRSDYMYLCQLFCDFFIPKDCRGGYVFDWDTQGLSNPDDKPIHCEAAGDGESRT